MAGDIDNTSYIELSDNPAVRSRVVYNIRRLPEERLQVGVINVSYGHVAVWREYDPEDPRWDAPWQCGTWRNVYVVVVPFDEPATTDRGKAYMTFSVKPVERDGQIGRLPRAELRMSRALVEHLEKAKRVATVQSVDG